MIKKKFRLTAKDLKNFFENKNISQISSEPYLKILYKENNLNFPRFAVIFPKNVFKRAFLRNKIKRRIYAIIRDLMKNQIFPGKDIIFLIKKDVNFFKLKDILSRSFSNFSL
jgi:ribonuclease P protein component